MLQEEALSKARSLVEAHQYIRRFRGRIVVVKLGGSIMDVPEDLAAVLENVGFMAAVGMRPVVVHGGGKGISRAMTEAGLEPYFVQGRRYTDERTLAIAEHVLVKEVNAQIVETIRSQGHNAMGLHSLGSCVLFAKRLFLEAQEPGEAEPRRIDVGYVGEVDWVNAELLRAMTEAGYIPVIAPIGRDPSGAKLNVNADSAAGRVAASLEAEKLVLVSDTHGIRLGEGDETLASTLSRSQILDLVRSGVISAGMLPKVEAGLVALEGGVSKAHIVDGRIPNSLMLEIYTDQGVGTELVLE